MKKIVVVLLVFLMSIGMINGNLIFAQQNEKDTTKKLLLNDSDSIEKTIKDYYDLAYDIYLNLELKDMSSVLNMESIQNQNFMVAMEKYIYQKKDWEEKAYAGKSFREKNILKFDFDKLEINGDKAIIKVNLEGGEDFKSYPAFVVLGENEFHLDKIEGKWLINEHYYDDWCLFEGSRTEKMEPVNYEEFQKILDENTGTDIEKLRENVELGAFFEKIEKKEQKTNNDFSFAPFYVPHEDIEYSSNRAVRYAKKFSENSNSRNPFFYLASLDCTNFISQCVSYGFGNSSPYNNKSSYRMVQGIWSAGSGGGFPAWESVTNHWNYMTRNKGDRERGPRVQVVSSINQLRLGGVMQVKYGNEYTHSVICISTNPYKFAQHSSTGIRDYDDYLPEYQKRFYNPLYFREY